jgi:hypothetical protein
MRTSEGKDVATIVFQAIDIETNKGELFIDPSVPEGSKLPEGYYNRVVATLQAWKNGHATAASTSSSTATGTSKSMVGTVSSGAEGVEVTFTAEYSHKFKRFVAHRVRAVGA